MDDEELVGAYLAGDTDAFAQIYDRYADRIHDFCHSVLRDRAEAADAMQDTFIIAARRVGQLRDASKLRSWLFAIARNESLRRAKRRARTVPSDEFRDLAAPDVTDGDVGRPDLQALVWSAAAGLSDRDRTLLDLHIRQGLNGQELADAIGVAPSHVYVMMNRLRAQMERSLGALLIARLGRDECPDLAAILSGWDGTFSVLVRKRVARHVDDCDVCGERRRALVSPLALLAAVPAVPAGAASRARVLDAVELISARHDLDTGSGDRARGDGDHYRWDDNGFPRALARHRRRTSRGALLAMTAAFLVVAGGGGAYLAAANDGRGGGTDIELVAEPSTTTATPDAVTAPDPTTTTAPPTTTTTLPTPTTAAVAGPIDDPDVTTPPTAAAPTTTTAPTDLPPTLSIAVDPDPIWTSYECGSTVASIVADADDDHGVVAVTFTYSTKLAGDGGGDLVYDEPSWYGVVGPLYAPYNDTVTIRVTARDTAGQTTTVTDTISLDYCLI